eukprot:scaffold16939_cov71-Phaeocystis_antarctica.AAC.2
MQPRRGHIARGIGALHIAYGHNVAPQHKRTLHLKAKVVCVALRGAYFSDADLEASHRGRVVGGQLRVNAHYWCSNKVEPGAICSSSVSADHGEAGKGGGEAGGGANGGRASAPAIMPGSYTA